MRMRSVSAALRRFGIPWRSASSCRCRSIFCFWLVWFVYGHGGGGDFAIFRRAGRAVLHGHSPYVHPTLKLLAANDRFVYPTPFALPFIPFVAGAREGCGGRIPGPVGGGGARFGVAARRPRLALLRSLAARGSRVRGARRGLDRSLPPPAVRARVALPRPHRRRCAARARGRSEALSLAGARVAARHASLPRLRGVARDDRRDPRALGRRSIRVGCAGTRRRSACSTTCSGGSRTRCRACLISLHVSAVDERARRRGGAPRRGRRSRACSAGGATRSPSRSLSLRR